MTDRPERNERAEHEDFLRPGARMPRAQVAFLRVALPLLLLATCVGAVALGTDAMRRGGGTWNTASEVSIDGVLVASPYPHLRIADADAPTGVRTVPVIAMGKAGVHDRVDALLDGAPEAVVRARGFVIERLGVRLLELLDAPDALDLVDGSDASALAAPTVRELGPATIDGELVDGKCWLGVMRPGSGLVHRACATLCVESGLPLFVAQETPAGTRPILVEFDDADLDAILPWIAIPVRIDAPLRRVDDRFVIRWRDAVIAAR